MNKQLKHKVHIPRIQKLILDWYDSSARSLPWRRTRNPYRILISEVMLKQTQVSRVLQKYPAFLRQFPRLEILAQADTAAVLRAWQGMGYNNRAVRLLHLARTVQAGYSGVFPRSIEALQSLPGVGRYTSHALACFAFGQQVPVVDTNVKRVVSRVFPSKNDAWSTAASVLPKNRAYAWNQALMDFGSILCTAASPRCDACPIRRYCPSAFRVKPAPRQPSSTEPQRGGVPNRIYRGRIVEAIRVWNRRAPISIVVLARSVKPNYSSRDRRWFNGLLKSLTRDGLISVQSGSVSFPK